MATQQLISPLWDRLHVHRLIAMWLILLLYCIPINSQANEITITHKLLTLNANLRLATNNVLSDTIILITHGGLGHNKMETIANLQDLLSQSAYSSLAINLSLGLDNRHGMYDCSITHKHLHSDAVEEIDAWISWLKKQGFSNIVLLGHSRGGAQTALYAATHNNELIKAVVLMAASTHDNGGNGYEQRYQAPLAPILNKALKLQQQGKNDAVIRHANLLYCRDTLVTAASFVSYYGQESGLDTPQLLSKINKPTMLIIAGNDEIVINLQSKIAHLDKNQQFEFKQIDGADHFFLDLNSDEAVEIMTTFIQMRATNL